MAHDASLAVSARGVGVPPVLALRKFSYSLYPFTFKRVRLGDTPTPPAPVRIGRKTRESGGIDWMARPLRLARPIRRGCRAEWAAGAGRFAVAVDRAGRCA